MKKAGRYDTSHLLEDQYEPGSRGLILKNRLGIRFKREMDQIETKALRMAEEALLRTYGRKHRFTAFDLRAMHRLWLGKIYAWAGNYRRVNISKEEFSFAFAAQVPKLMKELERGPLHRQTPCTFGSEDRIVQALAEVHAELLLVHPFREGNGRLARLLATLMALQAGLPPLDFRSIKGAKKQAYFAAVRAGMDRNYKPMEQMFREILRRTRGTTST